jgi:hypothetical protein
MSREPDTDCFRDGLRGAIFRILLCLPASCGRNMNACLVGV